MRLENPFNQIKPIATAGVLTVGAFLNQAEAQSNLNAGQNIPEIEIKNSKGKENEKKLEKIKKAMLDNVEMTIALLEKDIELSRNETSFKEDLRISIEENKNKVLDQLILIKELKEVLKDITLYQKRIDFFIDSYRNSTSVVDGVTDEKLKEFYVKLEKLCKRNFEIEGRNFDFYKGLEALSLGNFSGKAEEFKIEVGILLDTYDAKLNQQFNSNFTKDKIETFLENRWIGAQKSLPKKIEVLNAYKKDKEVLDQNRTLEFFRDTITSIYNETYKHIASDKYLNKLKNEFSSEETAILYQSFRLNKLKAANIEFELDTVGFCKYYVEENKIVFNFSLDLINSLYLGTPDHEFSHLTDQSGRAMSNIAILLYKDSWIGDEEFLRLRNEHPDLFKDHPLDEKKDLEYYNDLTELNARKRVLELYMEKTGIKKYEEDMNEKHYEKLIQLFKDGELDRNCAQILLLIPKEKLIKILNTIASSREEFKYIMGLVIEDKPRDPETYYGLTDEYREMILVDLQPRQEKLAA